ncbi:toll-like receptor 7 [Clavelina lepadiformis]|uniref:toll-like receptor 7 n=1 Tax=Clavelina lepadiformis TaxID=159417 RepID=UPI0040414567
MVFGVLTSSVAFAKDPLNPCKSTSSVNGVDFVSWTAQAEVPLNLIRENSPWLDNSFVYVDCYSRGLTSIPQSLSTDVEAIDFSYNAIRRVKTNEFGQYPKLILLNFLGNCDKGLTDCRTDFYIEPGALNHLVHLKWLILSFNFLREFPRELPTSILGLHIRKTGLAEVTTQLDNLTNLSLLLCESNCMSEILLHNCPRNFTISRPLPSNLKLVDLQFNNWDRIPRDLLPSMLEVFMMRGNPVTRLRKDEFVNTTGIEVLNLEGMAEIVSTTLIIEEGVFDPLTKLRLLNLSNNLIEFLSNETFRTNNDLEILDLSYNCLRKTIFQPTYLANLLNIRHLDLSFNNVPQCGGSMTLELLRIGQVFSNFSSLEKIMFGSKAKLLTTSEWSVQFNRIDKDSLAILSNLTHLSTIDISYCNVHHISSDALSGLLQLKSVGAAHNLLDFNGRFLSGKQTFEKDYPNIYPSSLLESDTKCDNSGLLDYSNNQITTISGRQELLLSTATVLDLSHNQIQEFRKDDFKHLNSLCSINISFNPIVAIDSLTFSALPNLRMISLVGESVFLTSYSFLCHLNSSSEVDLTWQQTGETMEVALMQWQEKENCSADVVFNLTMSKNLFSQAMFRSKINFLKFFPQLRSLELSDCGLKWRLPQEWFQGTLFLFCGTLGYSKWFKRLVFRKVHEYFRVQSLNSKEVYLLSTTADNEQAFVFFDHINDELGDWVDNKLVPGMINGNPSIKLLLAGCDVDAGISSTQNLLRFVTSCRKTILIFSGTFCFSPSCRFVLTALQELQHSAGRDQLILVEWHGEEAARVPELIQRTFNRKFYNFLRFDSSNDDDVMFFETLRTAFASNIVLND